MAGGFLNVGYIYPTIRNHNRAFFTRCEIIPYVPKWTMTDLRAGLVDEDKQVLPWAACVAMVE